MGLYVPRRVLCCMPMAMPQGHLVAFCTDLGIAPAHGAAMLSVLLGSAFVSRQFWGWLTDRIGGLRTVLAGSVCQIAAMTGFLLTQNEAGLFAVAAIFGFGFSGIIPAYVVAIRELFPAAEAPWRVPTVLLFTGSGMALGGWLAGMIYDWAGFYAIAFATGVAFNAAHIVVIGSLVCAGAASACTRSPPPSRAAHDLSRIATIAWHSRLRDRVGAGVTNLSLQIRCRFRETVRTAPGVRKHRPRRYSTLCARAAPSSTQPTSIRIGAYCRIVPAASSTSASECARTKTAVSPFRI